MGRLFEILSFVDTHKCIKIIWISLYMCVSVSVRVFTWALHGGHYVKFQNEVKLLWIQKLFLPKQGQRTLSVLPFPN